VARDLAIDLGTANTLVYARGKGIVLNEPTVIALNTRTQEVLAMGQDAWQMIGRTPGYIVAVRPLRQGAITDFDITERMIRLLLQRCGVSRLNRPRVLICVPSAITSVERRAVKEATHRAGASAAYLIEQPMAAAIGAGLSIHEPIGNMVVDVGGGTSETAVISLGGVVASEAIRCGGFDIDAAIQTYVRREHGVAIGERTAEEIKLAIGSAAPYNSEVKAEVRGRELMTGMPKTVVLTPGELRGAVEDQVRSFYISVAEIFERWVTRRSSTHTQRAYRQDVMDFVRFLGIRWPEESTRLFTVSVADVLAFRDVMLAESKAPKTNNQPRP